MAARTAAEQGGEMLDEVRRLALFGSGVAELTRHQAEQIVKDLVKAGDVRRQQASSAARDLYDRSRENRKAMTGIIRSEIQNQVQNLGLASKRDLERLERRIARLESDRKKTTTKKSTAKKTTAKKTSSSGSSRS
jgi:polyhydroxyalkanoate synthesis regulator phasin